MALQVTGVLPKQYDSVVKEALHRALDARPQDFVVEVSWPHSELVVHVHSPFEKRLKFMQPLESELARELFSVVSEIADGELGPA